MWPVGQLQLSFSSLIQTSNFMPLLRCTFAQCSPEVENTLFCAYCIPIYADELEIIWHIFVLFGIF